jgi:hypothetical protein
MTTFVSLLEGCRHNWNAANIIEISKIMIAREDWDFLERLLDISTVVQILQNASLASIHAFHALFDYLKDSESGGEALYQ